MQYYLKALQLYAKVTGRARRKEFWQFLLFHFIFAAIATIVDSMMGNLDTKTGGGPVTGLYVLATLIPYLAVTIRRLHDIGKSGWFVLIGFIPLIGAIWLIVLLVRDGVAGPNEYGPDPKAAERTSV